MFGLNVFPTLMTFRGWLDEFVVDRLVLFLVAEEREALLIWYVTVRVATISRDAYDM